MRLHILKPCPVWHTVSCCCLWIKIENSRLFLQHHVCLGTAVLSAIIIMDQTSKTVVQPQLNDFFIRITMGVVCRHNNKTLTKGRSWYQEWSITVIGLAMFLFGGNVDFGTMD